MSEIPKFPSVRRLLISDGPFFHDLFKKYPPIVSEYTFTNLFAWMHHYDFHISRYNDLIVMASNCGGTKGIYPPVGLLNTDILISLLKDAVKFNVADHFHCADERIVNLLEPFASELDIIPEPSQHDYIYLRSELVALKGRKFHDKKNLINQFERNYRASFEPMTVDSIREVIEFEREWCVTRECEKNPHLSKEACAIYVMLAYFEVLKLSGAFVRCDGKIIGITMGEPLNDDTFVVHAEKANENYKGVYQFLNQRLAAMIDPKYKWINREQDLGVVGLRRAKRSYNPVKMGKKYTIRLIPQFS